MIYPVDGYNIGLAQIQIDVCLQYLISLIISPPTRSSVMVCGL